MRKKEKKDDFIDLINIIKKLFLNKKIIIKNVILSVVLGTIYALSLPNIYKSSSLFYPHYEKNDNNNIRDLAGLAGINFENETSSIIPPNLYPQLISSTNFKSQILDKIIFDNTSFRNYLNNKNKKNQIFNFSFIKNFFLKNQKDDFSKNINLNYVSKEDFALYKYLDEIIKIDVNTKDGFIELSVLDENPEVSSIIAIEANKILQKSIIEFKIKNINDVYEFTKNQVSIAKKNLYIIQDSLANFRDSNINIKSDLFKNKLNRLETEFTIAKNIYNELAISKEKAEIDVRKNTPIFTIINSVVVPNEKFKPNRTLIIIGSLFLGILISMFIILIIPFLIDLRKILKLD